MVEEKQKTKEAELVQVATEYAPAVQLEDGTTVSTLELQVRIYNKLLHIEKALG